MSTEEEDTNANRHAIIETQKVEEQEKKYNVNKISKEVLEELIKTYVKEDKKMN